ncbi:GGDEF domain-containing protein [Rhodoferax sp. AJA081-3]|uniref:GGDEF domain-containing protein n=1 Tax=Rhodoferax sp. AJA081-3 TaxID=2752316 RepID=UPI001ADEF22A|nr:GGDEF domain-containing protein [Rhodoferax sp. AJA081-3]QTN29549.1 GGDEF domain-containing protein [Rhodoferax sp. AJA081-3]
MNESIVLLPAMEKTSQKIVVLQGALNLLNSLRAYDEALEFAERIYALRGDTAGSYAACVGLANKVETNYMRGSNATARGLVPDAILACDANKNQFFSLIVKVYAAIDVIDSGEHTKGIATSLPLLKDFSTLSKDSDYLTQLEEALARAYLKTGNTERAEHYGLKAYQRAQSSRVLALQEKTSETMAAIKRAQGQLAAAIGYYDINLDLKKKVLDDQLHKNLAYQRVKFDTQDKANQMALLEQKNKNLNTEKALQQNEYQNLILLLTLGAVVLAILGAWLYNTLRLKNIFRVSAQVDGLTQVSNRSHFTASSHLAFSDPMRNVSLVLFDMDYFKKINDTYGHAAGDWVLKTVCATVKSELPKTTLLGRLGGEEFALCLPNVQHEDEARALAERCRAAIAAINTAPSGFDFAITASFGVATRNAHLTDSFEETLVQADKALYLSKNEGRNRVTVYQPSGKA